MGNKTPVVSPTHLVRYLFLIISVGLIRRRRRTYNSNIMSTDKQAYNRRNTLIEKRPSYTNDHYYNYYYYYYYNTAPINGTISMVFTNITIKHERFTSSMVVDWGVFLKIIGRQQVKSGPDRSCYYEFEGSRVQPFVSINELFFQGFRQTFSIWTDSSRVWTSIEAPPPDFGFEAG